MRGFTWTHSRTVQDSLGMQRCVGGQSVGREREKERESDLKGKTHLPSPVIPVIPVQPRRRLTGFLAVLCERNTNTEVFTRGKERRGEEVEPPQESCWVIIPIPFYGLNRRGTPHPSAQSSEGGGRLAQGHLDTRRSRGSNKQPSV